MYPALNMAIMVSSNMNLNFRKSTHRDQMQYRSPYYRMILEDFGVEGELGLEVAPREDLAKVQ